MVDARHVNDSQSIALLAVKGSPAPRASQSALLAVFAPPSSRRVRDIQSFALTPYSVGKWTVPRDSQSYALAVYGTGIPDDRRQRCWGFTLDGHTFYVLDLGPEGTWLYDVDTKQWAKWITDGFGLWNMRNGCMWGQVKIVAGDTLYPYVWQLDPTKHLDEDWRSITHVSTGGLSTRSRVFHGMSAVRVTASAGILDEDDAVFRLRFSDNQGQTWSPYFDIPLTMDDFNQEIVWRSLGSFAAPGRVLELTDKGGVIRIDGCDAPIDNFDDDSAPAGGSGG